MYRFSKPFYDPELDLIGQNAATSALYPTNTCLAFDVDIPPPLGFSASKETIQAPQIFVIVLITATFL